MAGALGAAFERQKELAKVNNERAIDTFLTLRERSIAAASAMDTEDEEDSPVIANWFRLEEELCPKIVRKQEIDDLFLHGSMEDQDAEDMEDVAREHDELKDDIAMLESTISAAQDQYKKAKNAYSAAFHSIRECENATDKLRFMRIKALANEWIQLVNGYKTASLNAGGMDQDDEDIDLRMLLMSPTMPVTLVVCLQLTIMTSKSTPIAVDLEWCAFTSKKMLTKLRNNNVVKVRVHKLSRISLAVTKS